MFWELHEATKAQWIEATYLMSHHCLVAQQSQELSRRCFCPQGKSEKPLLHTASLRESNAGAMTCYLMWLFFSLFWGKHYPLFHFFHFFGGKKKNNSDKNSSKKIFQILMSWFGYCFWLRLFADQNISNPHIPYTTKKKEEIHFYLGNKAG